MDRHRRRITTAALLLTLGLAGCGGQRPDNPGPNASAGTGSSTGGMGVGNPSREGSSRVGGAGAPTAGGSGTNTNGGTEVGATPGAGGGMRP